MHMMTTMELLTLADIAPLILIGLLLVLPILAILFHEVGDYDDTKE